MDEITPINSRFLNHGPWTRLSLFVDPWFQNKSINTEEKLPHVSRTTFVPYGRIPHYEKHKVKKLDPNQFEIIVCKPGEKPFKQYGRYGIGLGYESI